MLILGKKMGLKRTHRDVTSTFCIEIMHPAREFSSTSKTLLRRLRRQTATSFLLGAPRNHPKGHYFQTIDNIQSAVTESPEEENSRYSCESGRTSREGIYFRGDNRNCHEFGNSRISTTVREDPEKIKDILLLSIIIPDITDIIDFKSAKRYLKLQINLTRKKMEIKIFVNEIFSKIIIFTSRVRTKHAYFSPILWQPLYISYLTIHWCIVKLNSTFV